MLGNRSNGRYNRGGVRGGTGHFKWDDVKADEERQNYIGHSLHAPIGRWQKGRDLQWWSKAKGGEESKRAEEIRQAQEADADAINEALGLGPLRRSRAAPKLEDHEVKTLLARGGEGAERDDLYTERVAGLGKGDTRYFEHLERATPAVRRQLVHEEEERRRALGLEDDAVGASDAGARERGRGPADADADADTGGEGERKSRKEKKEKKSKKDKKEKKEKKKKKKKKRSQEEDYDEIDSRKRRRRDELDEQVSRSTFHRKLRPADEK